MNPSFDGMTTPALVVAGDQDRSPLTVRGPDWFTDPYFMSPGDKSLLTLFGAEHSLGGIATASPRRPTRAPSESRCSSGSRRPTGAAPSTPGMAGWRAAVAALEEGPEPLGRVLSK
ncbi:hypothetical protein [Bailinhaonella thermotolerans]|uniref:hypothetical protein n=1 Tax=Bailinhaonella thermotolerans TaxID=1070861 RepID=UPI0026C36FD8